MSVRGLFVCVAGQKCVRATIKKERMSGRFVCAFRRIRSGGFEDSQPAEEKVARLAWKAGNEKAVVVRDGESETAHDVVPGDNMKNKH
eukprot:CAMPEP_0175181524 /NCGR_PEP_ID=MMETSP0087-20121206/36692_1 /TAXON_ID=136419 /ORGANISM="Unknown Unknown, Strain D1" /LENGTH=87 /DNA_ID=CAMNT_0016474027 /DNA_START=200 /DNA_END=460 /DNA_ORIENTATION=-